MLAPNCDLCCRAPKTSQELGRSGPISGPSIQTRLCEAFASRQKHTYAPTNFMCNAPLAIGYITYT
jgi:hypothetical protein